METPLDLRRWQEKPAGVNYRRWVIVSTGLRQIMRMRFFQILLFLAWTAGVIMAAAGFVFTQSLASGGWLENFAANLGPRPHAVVSAFCSMVLLYPDICVHGLFSVVFWWHSFIGLGLSLIALSVVMPRLIARDRASNALTIYLSRPLTSLDYLLGKLGIIVGILLLLWTGPLLFGWLLSMAFSPNSDFVVYSLTPLLRAGLFNLIALVTLAAVALGVSSLGKTTRSVMALWIGIWIIGGAIASIPTTPGFIRAASFSHDLQDIRQNIFKLDEILIKAGESLPLVDRSITKNMQDFGKKLNEYENAPSSYAGLAVLVIVSSLVFARRLRPE
jgi:hypothetical protein